MVDVYVDGLIFVVVFGRDQFSSIVLSFDQLPDVILSYVVGVEGAAADLVEMLAIWHFDLMGMQVVFCFNVAEDKWLGYCMRLAEWVELVQRFVEDLKLVLLHFYDAAHKD